MSKGTENVLLVLFVVLVVFALMLLGGWVAMLVWNLGMVPLVAACGGAVAKIGFWTAFWTYAGLNVVSQTFNPYRHSSAK